MLALTVFGAALAFAAYVVVGYPVVLAVLARWRARPIAKRPQTRPVSVVIAVHNGERFLDDKLRSVLDLDYPRELLEIIVVADGSTDGTEAIARRYASDGVVLVSIPHSGKCAALNAGVARAGGEILLLTDVRQPLAPDSLRRLVACFADPSVGVVSGELVIRSGSRRDESEVGLYWRFESWVRDQLGRIDSMFGATGPFYEIRRDLVVPLPPDMLLDDMYLPLAAFFRGYRLVVEPAARAFDVPTTRAIEFRRKVRTLAGNYQILGAYPQLLGTGNRMLLHYLSYKLGRLLLPWALLAIAVSSFFLPAPWSGIAVGGQALLYGLAALDGWIPDRLPLKRLSSPLRTFVSMMVAAVYALEVFFVPPRSLWRETTGVLSKS
jgi:cellulose synthase/poly-beta-1,6-N-acetylglucosamine synthase-like glycosyltransferase